MYQKQTSYTLFSQGFYVNVNQLNSSKMLRSHEMVNSTTPPIVFCSI